MSDFSLPWNLRCPWCTFYIEVNARGMRGADQGAGVEAADLMREHVATHGKSWSQFLFEPVPAQEVWQSNG